MQNLDKILGVLLCTSVVGGCAIPPFDTDRDQFGPTVNDVYRQIVCELVDMVRNDGKRDPKLGGGANNFAHGGILRSGNYQVSMNLSLQVIHTGDISPSFNFPSVTSTLAFNVGARKNKQRTHTFVTRRTLQMRELFDEWEKSQINAQDEEVLNRFGACPTGRPYTLSGKLGLKTLADLEFSAPGINVSASPNLNAATSGAFGGVITFAVTKNINALGPTFTLTNFVGPGNLASLERATTNTLTIAFGVGPDLEPGETPAASVPFNGNSSDRLLNEILLTEGS